MLKTAVESLSVFSAHGGRLHGSLQTGHDEHHTHVLVSRARLHLTNSNSLGLRTSMFVLRAEVLALLGLRTSIFVCVT